MSPLAIKVIHCPYGPGNSAPVKEDQYEEWSIIGVMPTQHTTGCVGTSQPQDTLNIGMYLDLGKKHSK